jgi:hypothetical protein
MPKVAINAATITMNRTIFIRSNIVVPMMFCFNPFSRSARQWFSPLRHFSYRAFARTGSQTHPITDRTTLALLA